MIELHPSREFKLPIIADCISPDVFQGKTVPEVQALKVWEGNKQKTLGALFKIVESSSEDKAETITVINGNVSKLKRIGSRMKKGEIVIRGDVGMHLGVEMRGGKITVFGNAGGWAGSMMNNGTIEIHGNAGDYLASPYRGSTSGIRGGKIIVHGNAGSEAGAYMKAGLIKILGSGGQFVGLRMHDGTIYVRKNCDGRAGACMVGGKIVVSGSIESVLPSFTIDAVKKKVKIEEGKEAEGPFYLFLGDLAENGNGKLYVSKTNNPDLSSYEKFL